MLRKALQMAKERHEEGIQNDDRGILSEIRLIGAGLVLLLVMVLVLTEVYNAVDVAEGPFAGVVDSLESTGAAAMTLLVVGLLVVAAMAIMRFFNGSALRGR